MANSFSNLFQVILKFGAMALRENAIMPRLVSQDFSEQEGEKGDTINITIPRPKLTENVSPGGSQTGNNRQHDKHPIKMDQWKQVNFGITDKEEREVFEKGILPADASEAIKALMNELDSYIITQMRLKVPGNTGTGAPAAVADIVNNRTNMVKQLSPMGGLSYIMNPDTEGAMLKLAVFHQADQSGGLSGLQEGNLGRKFGFQMFMDQNLTGVTLTSGDKAGTILVDDSGGLAVGNTVVAIDGGTAAKNVVAGDTFKVAGDTNQYIVLSETGDVNGGTITFFPENKVLWADDAILTPTYAADKVVTYHALALHPSAFGLVNRPMRTARPGLGVITETVVDPITGLAMRLEVTRDNKQDNWAWDILYGGDVVRPEFANWNTQVV